MGNCHLVSNIHFVPVQLCQRHVSWAQIVCRMLEGLGNELYAVPVLAGTALSRWEKEGDASFGQCLPQPHAGVRMPWHLTFSFLSLVWKPIPLSNPTKISMIVSAGLYSRVRVCFLCTPLLLSSLMIPQGWGETESDSEQRIYERWLRWMLSWKVCIFCLFGFFFFFWSHHEASLVVQLVKNPPAMLEPWVWSLG